MFLLCFVGFLTDCSFYIGIFNMPLIQSTNQQLYDFLVFSEGQKPHIYFDSIGKLTVGIGHLLGGTRQATIQQIKDDAFNIHVLYSFYVEDSVATRDDIDLRIDQLMKVKPDRAAARGYNADYWADKPIGTKQVKLNQQGMVRLKQSDAEKRIRGCCHQWPGRNKMTSLPVNIQIVIIDIAFNAGVGALKRYDQYKTFREAIENGEYEAAARNVERGGLRISNEARNRRRAAMLRGG